MHIDIYFGYVIFFVLISLQVESGGGGKTAEIHYNALPIGN